VKTRASTRCLQSRFTILGAGRQRPPQDRPPQFQARGCSLVLWGSRRPRCARGTQIPGHGLRFATAILRGHRKSTRGVVAFAAKAVVVLSVGIQVSIRALRAAQAGAGTHPCVTSPRLEVQVLSRQVEEQIGIGGHGLNGIAWSSGSAANPGLALPCQGCVCLTVR
jgi:hypothetical protein